MEKPIRILQVLGRLDRGGAETMLMNLYRCMDRSQIQFDFIIHTTDICDYTEEVKRLGGKIYSMKPFRASTAIHYRKQWKDFFREHKEYKVIHGHMRSTASLYLAEAKKAGLVTIVHSHNTSSGKGISALVKNVLQYPLRFQADYLFACSKGSGVWLYGEKACEKERFHILKNGIMPEAFSFSEEIRESVRNEMQAGRDLIFLHVGRMELQKNHVFLLHIIKSVSEKYKNVQLWLCGVGPLESEIKQQIKELDLEKQVRILGVRTDIPQLMQAADGMIFPSLFEGLPVTLIEAQAAGLPVLMSDTITEEVVLTDLVKTLPLSESAENWSERALKMIPGEERGKYREIVAAKGYDVKKNAKELAIFYKEIGE